MKNPLPAQITISRSSSSDGRDYVSIKIMDRRSRARVVEVQVKLADFTAALFGQGDIEAIAEYDTNLSVLGKHKIIESRQRRAPKGVALDRKELSNWLTENCQEDGWFIDPYLGSQNSIIYDRENGHILNYKVFRYADDKAE